MRTGASRLSRRKVAVPVVLALTFAGLLLVGASYWVRASSAPGAAYDVIYSGVNSSRAGLSKSFGRALAPGEFETAVAAIPDDFGGDPRLYHPSRSEVGFDRAAVQLSFAADTQFDVLVSMSWDWAAGRWRVLSLERVSHQE